MPNLYTHSFPYLMDGIYVLDNVIDAEGEPIVGGSGEITWKDDETGEEIAGQTWPAAISWNITEERFESEISKDCVTTLGQMVRGEITIDAANGKRYVDVLKIRVRAPSTEF